MMTHLRALLLGLALTQPALAGSGTITVTPGTGATYDVITDASGNYVGMQGVCDQSAAAYCAAVTSGHLLTVQASIASGGVASGAFASGSVASGAFASGSLAAGSMVDLLTMRAAIGGTTGSPADVLVQGCQYLASASTYTTGDSGAVQCTINGYPIVSVNNTNANGQATAANSSPVVLPAAQVTADPCSLANKTTINIYQNGTSSVQLVAVSGSTVVYVCSLFLMTNSTATTAAITTGTGTACVTNNAAVIGSTTANIANSMNLIAGAGFVLGNGTGTVAKGAASSELCLILGSNVYVDGSLSYVQQ